MATHKEVREDERRVLIAILKKKAKELAMMPGMNEWAYGLGTINGFHLAILEIELLPEVEDE